jgi:hypothetical protein
VGGRGELAGLRVPALVALAPDTADDQPGSSAQAGSAQQQAQQHVAGACYWLAGGRVYTSPLLEQAPAPPVQAAPAAEEAAEQGTPGGRKGKARGSSSGSKARRQQQPPEPVGRLAPEQPAAQLYLLPHEQAVQKVRGWPGCVQAAAATASAAATGTGKRHSQLPSDGCSSSSSSMAWHDPWAHDNHLCVCIACASPWQMRRHRVQLQPLTVMLCPCPSGEAPAAAGRVQRRAPAFDMLRVRGGPQRGGGSTCNRHGRIPEPLQERLAGHRGGTQGAGGPRGSWGLPGIVPMLCGLCGLPGWTACVYCLRGSRAAACAVWQVSEPVPHTAVLQVEAQVRKRRAGITAASLPAPMALSRFQWPQSQGKGVGRSSYARCGRCQHCLRPSMKKACLNPVRRDDDGPVMPVGPPGSASSKAGKLAYLQSYLLKAERDLAGLLGGQWAAPSGQGQGGGSHGSSAAQPSQPAGYWAALNGQLVWIPSQRPQQQQAGVMPGQIDPRQTWVNRVRQATSVRQLARLAVQLEAAIGYDLDVLAKGWDPLARRLASRKRQEAERRAAEVQRQQDAAIQKVIQAAAAAGLLATAVPAAGMPGQQGVLQRGSATAAGAAAAAGSSAGMAAVISTPSGLQQVVLPAGLQPAAVKLEASAAPAAAAPAAAPAASAASAAPAAPVAAASAAAPAAQPSKAPDSAATAAAAAAAGADALEGPGVVEEPSDEPSGRQRRSSARLRIQQPEASAKKPNYAEAASDDDVAGGKAKGASDAEGWSSDEEEDEQASAAFGVKGGEGVQWQRQACGSGWGWGR